MSNLQWDIARVREHIHIVAVPPFRMLAPLANGTTVPCAPPSMTPVAPCTIGDGSSPIDQPLLAAPKPPFDATADPFASAIPKPALVAVTCPPFFAVAVADSCQQFQSRGSETKEVITYYGRNGTILKRSPMSAKRLFKLVFQLLIA
ncbi:hypothetical protein BS47DRAFT_447285 [Hydnum rufescens UP504]|uniref:Uncharacterized protein n=1 Tax=Hydnum rufescens UP504 TaxID=1448309 RepID=A0A9P6B505_9AGAM|nr:hypothetical protein BS47DRAFT_447285 [Hydnum rufescens UP504]